MVKGGFSSAPDLAKRPAAHLRTDDPLPLPEVQSRSAWRDAEDNLPCHAPHFGESAYPQVDARSVQRCDSRFIRNHRALRRFYQTKPPGKFDDRSNEIGIEDRINGRPSGILPNEPIRQSPCLKRDTTVRVQKQGLRDIAKRTHSAACENWNQSTRTHAILRVLVFLLFSAYFFDIQMESTKFPSVNFVPRRNAVARPQQI